MFVEDECPARRARPLGTRVRRRVRNSKICSAEVRLWQSHLRLTHQRSSDATSKFLAIPQCLTTVRQRKSYPRTHILPRFGEAPPGSLDVPGMQQCATELQQLVAPNTVINVLGTVFAILRYAKKCSIRTVDVFFRYLTLRNDEPSERPYFISDEASRIIAAAEEPYKTMFAIPATTGLRAGEPFALTVADLDSRRKTIRVSKSADDNTRMIREPKTKKSVALLPMASTLAAMLRDYLQRHWKDNEKQFLFPNRKGTLPRWRDNVLKYGLKPVLRKLETPERNARLHTFRRGLATELAETEPITVLQTQMRHADVRTTLRVYAHVIPDSQQGSMERITNRSIGKIASESAKARINTGEHAPTVQIYQLAWEMGCKYLTTNPLAEACGSRSYFSLILQILTRKLLD